jgi:hypothetical protein
MAVFLGASDFRQSRNAAFCAHPIAACCELHAFWSNSGLHPPTIGTFSGSQSIATFSAQHKQEPCAQHNTAHIQHTPVTWHGEKQRSSRTRASSLLETLQEAFKASSRKRTAVASGQISTMSSVELNGELHRGHSNTAPSSPLPSIRTTLQAQLPYGHVHGMFVFKCMQMNKCAC